MLESSDVIAEAGLFKDFPESVIGSRGKRVDILPDCSFEEKGHLRNHGDVLSKGVQAHLQGIVAVYFIGGPRIRLKYSKQRLDDGRFSCSRPADNSYFLIGSYFEF